MRLITAADLTFVSDPELTRMIREFTDRLHTMDASTYDYAILRDSLGVLQRERAARLAGRPKL